MIKNLKNHPLCKFQDFRKLFLGRVISSTGDKFFTIALSWIVISGGDEKSKLQLGILMAVNMIPIIIFGPFMGKIVDKYNKKKCMITADIGRFVFTMIVFILLKNKSLSNETLYIFCFIIASFAPLFEAAVSASLEKLTDKDSIAQVVAIDSTVIYMANILGALIGGIALIYIGTEGAVFLNSISFLVSFLLISRIKKTMDNSISYEDKNNTIREGVKFICNNKAILSLMIIFTIFNFFVAPLCMLIPLMVKFIFNETSSWIGYLEASIALGSGIMAVLLSFKRKYRKMYLCIFFSMIIIGISTLLCGIVIDKYFMCIMLFIMGICLSMVDTIAMSIFQIRVPSKLKGRFFSILTTVSFAIIPVAYLINSILSQIVTIPKIFIINGTASIILAFVVLIIPNIRDDIYVDEKYKNKEFKVKKMEEKEAKGVVKCAYEAYGESYIYRYIYSSQELIKLNMTGSITSYVAIGKNEEVVGHIALEKDDNLYIYELFCAFIHPFYRGKGYLKSLTEDVIEICKHEGIKGVFVRSVTSHTYSQKSASRNGFKECALLLSRIKSLDFKGICSGVAKRENLLVGYKYLKKTRRKKFYVMENHMDIIQCIYKNMGVEVEFKKKYKLNMKDLSVSSIRVISKENIEAVIFIDKVGREIVSEILRIVSKLKTQGKRIIILRMKLNDKFTPHICKCMEKHGFIFGGVMPGYINEDELILQYVEDEVDFENISLNSKMGQRLFNYVKQCYIDNLEERGMSI